MMSKDDIMVVWKYELNVTGEQTLMLPVGAKLLSIKEQGDKIFLWALVDEENDIYPITIAIVGTGHDCWCHDWEYFDTVMTHGGVLVWHIFIKR